MDQELRKKIMEEITNNVDTIEAIIYLVNEELNVPSYHNVYSYFLTGHCNVYSLILMGIFEGYATPYDCSKEAHIVTKIGDNYYDVEGLANWKVEDSKYTETYKDYLLEPDIVGLGNYETGIDDRIVEQGIRLGKAILEDKIKYRMEHRTEFKL